MNGDALPHAVLAVTRGIHLAASLLPLGALAFLIHSGMPHGSATNAHARVWRRSWRAIAIALLLAAASGAGWLLEVAAESYGLPVAAVANADRLGPVLRLTRFGHVWQGRTLALTVLFALFVLARWVPLPRRRLHAVGALVAAALLLLPLGWIGHAAAASKFASLRLAADMAHLLAAAVWLGGLPPLWWALDDAVSGPADDLAVAQRATERFSAVGMICVATLLVTGPINAAPLDASAAAWFGSSYGRLLLGKLGLFALLLGLAGFNRLRLMPRLEAADAVSAVRRLRQNVIAEMIVGLGIVAVVGWLGADMPPHAGG